MISKRFSLAFMPVYLKTERSCHWKIGPQNKWSPGPNFSRKTGLRVKGLGWTNSPTKDQYSVKSVRSRPIFWVDRNYLDSPNGIFELSLYAFCIV